MPKMISKRNMKFISVLMLTVVLVCSFCGYELDVTSYKDSDVPISNFSYVSKVSNLDEVISTEEITAGVSQAALIRQLSTRKNSVDSFAIYFMSICLNSLLFLAFLAFLNLHDNQINSSDRFTIRYIHDKDGQKA